MRLWLVGVGCSKILLRFGNWRGQSRALRRTYLNPLMRHYGPAPVAVPLDHEVAMSGARPADDTPSRYGTRRLIARINLVSAHTHAKRKAFRQRRFRWFLVLHRTASLILRRRAKQAAGQSGHQNARKPRSSRKIPGVKVTSYAQAADSQCAKIAQSASNHCARPDRLFLREKLMACASSASVMKWSGQDHVGSLALGKGFRSPVVFIAPDVLGSDPR